MIISTSSHNVQLTDSVCEYVDVSMRGAFASVASQVVSIDARLESVGDSDECHEISIFVRVFLRNQRAVVSETRDDDLYAAIRHGAVKAARVTGRRLQRSVTGKLLPGHRMELGRHFAAST